MKLVFGQFEITNEPEALGYLDGQFNLIQMRRNIEKAAILQSLVERSYNIARTAKFLGMNRTTLTMKMKVYGIKRHEVTKSGIEPEKPSEDRRLAS